MRAAARRREALEAREWPGVELAEADALAPETLDAALRGIDVAYYLDLVREVPLRTGCVRQLLTVILELRAAFRGISAACVRLDDTGVRRCGLPKPLPEGTLRAPAVRNTSRDAA